MQNETTIRNFHIVAFSTDSDDTIFIFSLLSILYLVGLLMNLTIITVIYITRHLHSPLYFFLCNLSVVDIYFTTTTIPSMLYMLLTKDNTISIEQCYTQLFFFYVAPSAEDMLLVLMAYDRYVAICNPLRYHNILNRKMSLLLICASWVTGIFNSLVLTIPASRMFFCHSDTVRQFFCEAKALTTIACSGTELFYSAVYADILLVGLCSFLCSLASYARIIIVIMDIKSRDGRKKAFSTCSSHLTVITLYYSTASAVYLLPTSKYSGFLEQGITVLYAVITPMVNPLIYSLRNNELITATHKLFRIQF